MNQMQYLVNEKENKVVTTLKDAEGFSLFESLDDLSFDEVMAGCVTSFYMGNTMDADNVNRLMQEFKDENLKLVTAKELFELTLKLGE